jgi:hypothetical protein
VKSHAVVSQDGLIEVDVNVRFDVYVLWKDGRGGVHSKKSLGEAIEEAEGLARRGYGKAGKEIRITKVTTKSWKYEL